MKTTSLSAIMLLFATLTMSFILSDGWEVPAADAAKENPVAADNASVEAGKALYIKHCKMCHGVTGEGGKMAGESNLTSAAFQGQTDGTIYYQTTVGYGKMPAYDKKIADDKDRWHLVNYLRTLKK